MGGGPSREQKDAAAAQAAATRSNTQTEKEMLDYQKQQMGKINPFETSRLNNGLPFAPAMFDFQGGTLARSMAPQRAGLARAIGGSDGLPSGFAAKAISDFNLGAGRAYDDQMVQGLLTNEAAKNNAAQALTGQQQLANPLGWAGQVSQGNSSIMNAPLQSPGWGGVLGGLAGGAMKAIPF